MSALRETIVGDAAAAGGLYLAHRQEVSALDTPRNQAFSSTGEAPFAPCSRPRVASKGWEPGASV